MKSARASNSPELPEISRQWIAAKSKVAKLDGSASNAASRDPTFLKAVSDAAEKSATAVRLQEEVAQEEVREAAQRMMDQAVAQARSSRIATGTGSAQAEQWYVGGTLHKKTMRDWRTAGYADRLATAADFVATASEADGKPFGSMSELKLQAIACERAISQAGEGGVADKRRVAEVAAAVVTLMQRWSFAEPRLWESGGSGREGA